MGTKKFKRQKSRPTTQNLMQQLTQFWGQKFREEFEKALQSECENTLKQSTNGKAELLVQ